MQRFTWIKSEYQIKTKSTCYNSGPRYLQIQHATINLLNAKIHLELHWSIEWKLEVTATFPGKVSTKEQTEIRFNTRRLNRWMQRITWIKFEYRIKTKSNCYNSGPKYPPQKRKRRSDSIRNDKFIEWNDSPELNWGVELKLEASPTASTRSKKQMNSNARARYWVSGNYCTLVSCWKYNA